MAKKPLIPVTPSSGNVFADIGVPEPEEELGSEADVHRVTQAVGALRGIIVFPWDGTHSVQSRKASRRRDSRGWPSWRMSGSLVQSNKVKNVGDLVELVRNSVAHGNVRFDADSKQLNEVTITLKNHPKGSRKVNWCGVIRADELVLFCQKFAAARPSCAH
jgi:hypothetical protein